MSGVGISCPACGHDVTDVKDTRAAAGENMIRRRRHCARCGYRFRTNEAITCTDEITRDIPGGRVFFDITRRDRGGRYVQEGLALAAEQIARALPAMAVDDARNLAVLAERLVLAASADADEREDVG